MKEFIRKILNKIRPFSSARYWEGRYKGGGNSGSGSYNELANYKANFINDFINTNNVQSAIEFGCGDGNQLSFIKYPKYTGLDVSPTAIALCQKKFKADPTKSFLLYQPFRFDNKNISPCDLSLSLDVIYHLIEDRLFETHMRHLFKYSSKFVIIYSSDEATDRVNHERGRHFSEWIEKNQPKWKLLLKKVSPYKNESNETKQSLSDFFIYQKQLGL